MPLKRKSAQKDSSWQRRRSNSFIAMRDDDKDILLIQKQKIADRIKSAEIKEKKVYKVKLGDDLRPFEYTVTKIDRLEGDVWLKSERGTVRKARVFDAVFGQINRGRPKATKYKQQ